MVDEGKCRMGPIENIPRDEAAEFLTEFHYMTYVPKKSALKYYAARDGDGLISCVIAVNNRPTNQYVSKRHFGDGWKALNIGELSRMACRHECPKLTESMFLSRLLKKTRALGFDALLSYADMAEEHVGTIYKATNWYYTGLSALNPKFFITDEDGVEAEMNWRQCRHKYNASHEAGLRRVLGDRLRVVPGKGKHRFVYCLTRKAKAMLRMEEVRAW